MNIANWGDYNEYRNTNVCNNVLQLMDFWGDHLMCQVRIEQQHITHKTGENFVDWRQRKPRKHINETAKVCTMYVQNNKFKYVVYLDWNALKWIGLNWKAMRWARSCSFCALYPLYIRCLQTNRQRCCVNVSLSAFRPMFMNLVVFIHLVWRDTYIYIFIRNKFSQYWENVIATVKLCVFECALLQAHNT